MTAVSAVQVPFTVAALQRCLGLPDGQRVLRFYVEDDPHRAWIVIEGGEELPDPEMFGVGGAYCETRQILTGPDWPMPRPGESGERRTVKVGLAVPDVERAMGLPDGRRVQRMFVHDNPYLLVVVVEGGAELPGPEAYREVDHDGYLPSVAPGRLAELWVDAVTA